MKFAYGLASGGVHTLYSYGEIFEVYWTEERRSSFSAVKTIMQLTYSEIRYSAKHRLRLKVSALIVVLLSSSCGGQKGEYSIAKIDVGSRRSIEILASHSMEVTQSFYYQVRAGDEIVVPLSMICAGHDTGTQRFKTVTAKHGDLVGVFEQRYPSEILAMHDFTSNSTWPQSFNLSPLESNQLGERLLKELQAEHNDLNFTMGRGTGCN